MISPVFPLSAVYYHASLPKSMVVEDQDGRLYIRRKLDLTPITSAELVSEYRGHRQSLLEVPPYVWAFYGIKNWISQADAEREFGFAPRSLAGLIKRNRIRSLQVGSARLVDKASLAAWVASNPKPGRKPKEQK